MEEINLKELSSVCHNAALKNGWYDKDSKGNITPRDEDTVKTLIGSEMLEAFEAFRGGKYAKLGEYVNIVPQGDFKTAFKAFIKDTFEDEIADTAIRILDHAGFKKLDLVSPTLIGTAKKGEFQKDIKAFNKYIVGLYDSPMTAIHAQIGLNMCFSIAAIYNVDLLKHIELKLAYNATRGAKHGGKVL